MEKYKTKTYRVGDNIKALDIERLVKIGNGEITYSELAFHPSDIPDNRQISIRAKLSDFEILDKAFSIIDLLGSSNK